MFRSVPRLARRAVVAGVAAAIALTLFDAVQPTLGGRPRSGTVRDVPLTLTPEAPGPVALAAATQVAAPAGERGRAARRPTPPAVSQPVAVGKARMVGFSWPDPAPAPAGSTEEAGVWMRARAAGGWSGWREVEVSAEGPDATSPEYDPDRVYTDGQRLLAWKLDLSHVDPRQRTTLTSRGGANVRYPAGRRVAVPVILGHRTTSFTACPGSPVMNLLPAIRAGAARIGLPKIFGGATAGSAVTPGGRSVATRARFSGTVNWTATVTGSDGARVRTWSGRGSAMAVGWNGRSGSGAAAPAGWATMTVTVRSGSSFARPVASAAYVRRATPLGGTTTGAFARGNWALTTRNVDQERPRSFIRVSFGRQPGDVPVVGDWDGNGSVTPGVLRAGARWYLRNTVGGGAANLGLRKQVAGTPVVGDFDGAP